MGHKRAFDLKSLSFDIEGPQKGLIMGDKGKKWDQGEEGGRSWKTLFLFKKGSKDLIRPLRAL